SRPIEGISGLGLSPAIHTYGSGVFQMLFNGKSYQAMLLSGEQYLGLLSENDKKEMREAIEKNQGIKRGRIISGGQWGIMPDSLNRSAFDSNGEDIGLSGSSPVRRKSKSADRYRNFIGFLGMSEKDIAGLREAESRRPFHILESMNKEIVIIAKSISDTQSIINSIQQLRSRQKQGECLSDEIIKHFVNRVDNIIARPRIGRGTTRIKREVIKPVLGEIRERLLDGDLQVVFKLRVVKPAFNQRLNELNITREKREAGLANKWKNYNVMSREEMKPLSDFSEKRGLPRVLERFMPYAENISYKEEKDNRIFLRVRFRDEAGKTKYVYLYLGLNDNLDKALGGNERLFGLTLRGWRKLVDPGYNPDRIECRRPREREHNLWDDGIFGYKNPSVPIKLWVERDRLFNLSITKLIEKIDAGNTGKLKKIFKKLFKEMEIAQPLSEKTWLKLSNIVFGENKRKGKKIPERFWVMKKIIAGYLNKQYPKLFLGWINVTAQPKRYLELWPVIENPNINASLLNWLVSASRRGPPPLYLKAEKISISRLLNSLASSSSSSPVDGLADVVKIQKFLNSFPQYDKDVYEGLKSSIFRNYHIRNPDTALKIEYNLARICWRGEGPVLRIINWPLGIILNKLPLTEDNIIDILESLIKPFDEITQAAGPAAKAAFWRIYIILESQDLTIANVNGILGNLVKIVQAAGSAAEYPLLAANVIIEKLPLIFSNSSILENLTENFSKICQYTQQECATAVVFNILRARLKRDNLVGEKNDVLKWINRIFRDIISDCERYGPQTHFKLLKKEPSLERIEFGNDGNCVNRLADFAKVLLWQVPAVWFRRPAWIPSMPVALSSFEKVSLEELAQIAQMRGGLRFEKALGRTAVFIDGYGNRLFIKFLKAKNEPNSLLKYEDDWFEGVGENMVLKHNPPKPLYITEGKESRFKFLLEECRFKKEIKRSLEKAVKEKSIKGRFSIDKDYIAMAYTVKKGSGYAGYLKKDYVSDWKEFKRAILNAASDLGVLAKEGIVHTALVDTFHNLSVNERRYIATADLNSSLNREGVGRLTAWKLAIRYPNIGFDGALRDYAELRHISDILEDSDFLGKDMAFIKEQFGSKAVNFFMLEFLCEYVQAFILLIGGWQDENNWRQVNWNNNDSLLELSELIKNVYLEIVTSFTGKSKAIFEDVFEFVDWQRLSRQIAFYMSPAYIEYFAAEKTVEERKKRFPKNIYPEGVEIGFKDYRPGSWDNENGCVGDETAELLHIRKERALGFVNGAYPIQEEVTASRYIFGLVLAQLAAEQNASSPVSDDVSQPELFSTQIRVKLISPSGLNKMSALLISLLARSIQTSLRIDLDSYPIKVAFADFPQEETELKGRSLKSEIFYFGRLALMELNDKLIKEKGAILADPDLLFTISDVDKRRLDYVKNFIEQAFEFINKICGDEQASDEYNERRDVEYTAEFVEKLDTFTRWRNKEMRRIRNELEKDPNASSLGKWAGPGKWAKSLRLTRRQKKSSSPFKISRGTLLKRKKIESALYYFIRR
ncbi:MAG: hypothetical protein KKH11_02415, partial [Candidatus Omnitrophica bacterium]|nr:hypothetical protein [Candidatus Omnitrophota bacterium]